MCSYEYTWRVAATDLYEGLSQVSDAFVGTTMTALDDLQQLHTYLLIATIIVFVAVVLVVLVPFRKRLMVESVRLAGLLSQLPQVRGLGCLPYLSKFAWSAGIELGSCDITSLLIGPSESAPSLHLHKLCADREHPLLQYICAAGE